MKWLKLKKAHLMGIWVKVAFVGAWHPARVSPSQSLAHDCFQTTQERLNPFRLLVRRNLFSPRIVLPLPGNLYCRGVIESILVFYLEIMRFWSSSRRKLLFPLKQLPSSHHHTSVFSGSFLLITLKKKKCYCKSTEIPLSSIFMDEIKKSWMVGSLCDHLKSMYVTESRGGGVCLILWFKCYSLILLLYWESISGWPFHRHPHGPSYKNAGVH